MGCIDMWDTYQVSIEGKFITIGQMTLDIPLTRWISCPFSEDCWEGVWNSWWTIDKSFKILRRIILLSLFFGVGHSKIPWSLAGSIANFSFCTTSPRYSIFCFWNSHFLALKNKSCSRAFSSMIFLSLLIVFEKLKHHLCRQLSNCLQFLSWRSCPL